MPTAPDSQPASPPPRKPSRRPSRSRLLVYLAVLFVGVLGAHELRATPQGALGTVLALAKDSKGARTFFHEGGAALSFQRGIGYILVLYVEYWTPFQPARYLTLTRSRGTLRGEIIVSAGIEGVSLLEGAELDAFLREGELSLKEVDQVFQALYATAPPPLAVVQGR